ncbi:MAG: cysteine desulfurase family protein [Phycisphaerae bacterium]
MSISDDAIYMDYNSTTPVDPRVAEAMRPYFSEVFGNAAAVVHEFGRRAAAAVEAARDQTAKLMNASAEELVFTSGATESCNLAIKGVAQAYRDKGEHIVTSAAEHKAVLDTCQWLETQGVKVTYLRPDACGRVSPQQVAEAITDRTILVTLMLANNEVGTLNPIGEIARVCKDRGVLLHSDATQAVGKIPVDVREMDVDLLSFSAHKFYGPKGIGGLYVRRRRPRVRPAPQMHGGGHERGLRSGTLNVPGAVGMGAAADICRREMSGGSQRVGKLRDRLAEGLMTRLDDVKRNGAPGESLPNTLNLSFAHVEGQAVILRMGNVAVSTGSACTTGSQEPSHVLRAMGLSGDQAHGSLRFSLGRWTTQEEVDAVIERCVAAVTGLRKLSVIKPLRSGKK